MLPLLTFIIVIFRKRDIYTTEKNPAFPSLFDHVERILDEWKIGPEDVKQYSKRAWKEKNKVNYL